MRQLLLLLMLGLAVGAVAADPLLEQRLSRLERIVEQEGGSALVLQVQQLQKEMQELRGMVETQQFEIDRLQRQQRDQYLDIDARLGQQGAATPAPAPIAGPSDLVDPLAPTSGAIDASGMPRPPGGLRTDPSASALPSAGVLGIPSLPSPETTSGTERDAYAAAFDLLKERNYGEATQAFTQLIAQYPQGQYADNALYWLGETYYVQRNYDAALREFERLVRDHPASAKAPGSALKIGYIHYEQRAFDRATRSLRDVISRYPNSTEARLAQSRLDRMEKEQP